MPAFRIVFYLLLLTFIFYSKTSRANSQAAIKQLIEESCKLLPSNTDSAFFYIKQAEALANEEESELLVACYHVLGRIFFKEAAFNQAIDYFLKARQIIEVEDNIKLKAENANLLGDTYYYLQNKDKSITYHREALHLFSQLGDSTGLATTFGYLGHYFEKTSRYDSALYYQNQALKIYDKQNEWYGKKRILENLGSIYEDIENYDTAWHYFLSAYHLNQQFGAEADAIQLLNNLGDIQHKTRHYDSAFYYMSIGLQLAKKHHNSYQRRSIYRDLSQLFSDRGDFQKAYKYLDSSVVFYKEIYSEEGLRQVARLQTFYEAEKKDREIALLAKDKKINQLILLLAFTSLGAALLIGFIIITRQRQKMQQSRKSFETRQEIMKTELEAKSQSLTTHSLHIIRKNQLLQELKDEIKSIYKEDGKGSKKQLKNLTKQIETNIAQDDEWNDFRKVFEQVHDSFFHKVRKINPELSPSEIKLAALIKTQLDSKEIATILNISTDSLRISRYRLRKRLGLSKDQKLSSFIQQI